jgi:starvation-inducible outer membrane lipoprotein
VDREPDDDRDDGEEGDQAAEAGHQRRDQHPFAGVPDPAARNSGRAAAEIAGVLFPFPLAHQPVTGGGAIASATRSVSRRRRSAVFVKIVMPMLTIWTIPETTIIAPKIPRAM